MTFDRNKLPAFLVENEKKGNIIFKVFEGQIRFAPINHRGRWGKWEKVVVEIFKKGTNMVLGYVFEKQGKEEYGVVETDSHIVEFRKEPSNGKDTPIY